MLKIKLTSTISILGSDEYSLLELRTEADIFDYNRTQVLNCFSSIEDDISRLIEYDIIGEYSIEKKEQHDKFRAKILYTSWFNFNEKRKLVTDILNEGISSNKKKKELDELFRKIMNYRNALMHGKFISNGSKSILEYYQGELKKDELNDDYWKKAKNYFEQALDIILESLTKKKILI
jgi:hypothetical protein